VHVSTKAHCRIGWTKLRVTPTYVLQLAQAQRFQPVFRAHALPNSACANRTRQQALQLLHRYHAIISAPQHQLLLVLVPSCNSPVLPQASRLDDSLWVDSHARWQLRPVHVCCCESKDAPERWLVQLTQTDLQEQQHIGQQSQPKQFTNFFNLQISSFKCTTAQGSSPAYTLRAHS
jgi:hypothetical protein